MKSLSQYGSSCQVRTYEICVQIGRLVKNEPNIEMAIADEIQNFKDYGGIFKGSDVNGSRSHLGGEG